VKPVIMVSFFSFSFGCVIKFIEIRYKKIQRKKAHRQCAKGNKEIKTK